MSITLADVLLTLQRTPRVLEALLRGLPDEITHRPYAPRAFSAYNVVGHLVIGEREDWIPRLKIILQHGESRPFDPFDHTATIHPADGPPLAELLQEFEVLRTGNVGELQAMNLSEEDLNRTGTHPALGRVTARELLCTWAAHDLHHTAQICKGLVGRLAEHVGPWRPYVSIFATLRAPQ